MCEGGWWPGRGVDPDEPGAVAAARRAYRCHRPDPGALLPLRRRFLGARHGEAEVGDGAGAGVAAAAVVAGGGDRAGVAGELLGGGQVVPGLRQNWDDGHCRRAWRAA